MFITLTINTQQRKKSFINLHKSKINAQSGWRKAIHAKKRPLLQRLKTWHRSFKQGQYKLDGQAVMF